MDKRVIHFNFCKGMKPDVSFVSKSGKEFQVEKITFASTGRVSNLSYADKIKTSVGIYGSFVGIHMRPEQVF